MKFAAVLLATASAFHLKESMQAIKTKVDSLVHKQVSNDGFVITQVSGQENFVMDADATQGTPFPVTAGVPEKFHIAGLWLVPTHLYCMEFTCNMFGAKVFDEDTKFDADMTPNAPWSADLSFDVPSFTPKTKYDIAVFAWAEEAKTTKLFELQTSFTL